MMQKRWYQNVVVWGTNIDGGNNPPPEIAIIAKLPMFLLCRKLSANRLLVSRGNLKRADDSLINSLSSFSSKPARPTTIQVWFNFLQNSRRILILDLILHCLNFWKMYESTHPCFSDIICHCPNLKTAKVIKNIARIADAGPVTLYSRVTINVEIVILNVYFGQVMSPHHSDQMSQRSHVSRIALSGCTKMNLSC